jgi:hypothetical protein
LDLAVLGCVHSFSFRICGVVVVVVVVGRFFLLLFRDVPLVLSFG